MKTPAQMEKEAREIGYLFMGMIGNYWAMIDQCTDLLILRYLWRSGQLDVAAPKVHWRQLTRKLETLRQAASELSEGEAAASQSSLCDRTSQLYIRRNDVVHGMAHLFKPTGLTVTRWEVRENHWHYRHTKLSLIELGEFSQASGKAADEFSAWDSDWQRRWPLPNAALVKM